MIIPIADGGEFHRVLFALADELVMARIHFRLYRDLTAAFFDYNRELHQSFTFWSLTLGAQMDATMLRLCKAYDQYERPTVNLRNLLDTIAANLHLFDEPNFRERLKGNAFVDSLAEDARRPDAVQLEKDQQAVSTANPLVKKLTFWRSNYYAHLRPAQALDPQALAKSYTPLALDDIEALLGTGVAIVNRYSERFVATVHSTTMVGQDDYLTLFKHVREALNARDDRIQEEFKKFGGDPGNR